jgi:hypothetical protein
MTEKRLLPEALRLKIIEACVKRVENGNSQVDEKYKSLLAEIEEEKASEDFVVNHGVLQAQEGDIKDEVSLMNSIEEEIDFDHDENEVCMSEISPLMRAVYEEK